MQNIRRGWSGVEMRRPRFIPPPQLPRAPIPLETFLVGILRAVRWQSRGCALFPGRCSSSRLWMQRGCTGVPSRGGRNLSTGRGDPIVHCVVESLLPDSSSDPSLVFPAAAPWSLTAQSAWPPRSHVLSCCKGGGSGKAVCSVLFLPRSSYRAGFEKGRPTYLWFVPLTV